MSTLHHPIRHRSTPALPGGQPSSSCAGSQNLAPYSSAVVEYVQVR